MTSPPHSPFSDAREIRDGRASNARGRWVAFGVWCLLICICFQQALWKLLLLAKTDMHSHTVLIPFISAYLLRGERKLLSRSFSVSWLSMAFLTASAVTVTWNRDPWAERLNLGENGSIALFILAFVFAVWAGGFLCFGRGFMKSAIFPMSFLIFMVPLPEGVVYSLEYGLKLASAEAAAWLFDVFQVPVLRDGVFFRLPGLILEVAQECSGIRSTYVLFMTSLLAAHLFLHSKWRRLALVVFVIPLGIVRNGIRILTIGWLCVQYGPEMVDTWIHHRGGPVFFLLSLVPLFLLLWLLRRGERKPAETKYC